MSTAVATGTGVRDLSALFDPRSVAVVGASDDPAKWGHHLAVQLLRAPGGRTVHLVNRRGGTVLGRPALTRLQDADGPVDLVAICVPAAGFLDAVDDALASGARAIVGITAGLSEASPEGREIELEALRRIHAAGAVLVGPNCLGVIDTTSSLFLASEPFTAGPVAVLSQSGNLVIDVDDLLARRGLGISRFVSLGNQADVSLAELMRACVDHDGTRAVAVYAEDVNDGRAFVAAARALASVGKPVVLLAPGRSAAASRGAASHTGSLTSPARVVDAACTAGGVHRVETPHELVDALVGLVGPRRAHGRRTAVLTDGGGHGAIASDAVAAVGLEVPQLSAELGERLTHALWAQSTVSNPVDLAGVGEQDPSSYARGVATLLGSDEVDAVLLVGYFGGYAHHALEPGRRRGAGGARDRRGGPGAEQAAGGPLDLPGEPERPGAGGGGHPGAPRLRRGGRIARRAVRLAARGGARSARAPAARRAAHGSGVRRDPRDARRLRRDVPRTSGRARRARAAGRARVGRAAVPGGAQGDGAAAQVRRRGSRARAARRGVGASRRTATSWPASTRPPSRSRRWPTSAPASR